MRQIPLSVDRDLRRVVHLALDEDLGFGDVTTQAIFQDKRLRGRLIAKADGVIAGLDAVRIGYEMLDRSVRVELMKQDGDTVQAGELLAVAEGCADILLTGERVVLNLVQHLSGIATETARAVVALKGSSTKVCDTRKTLPGLRLLQKYAVRCGGGQNHRMRLDDGVIIKDNHILAAGGVKEAVAMARAHAGHMVRIEVECETLHQVCEAVEAGADVIMLDNQTPESARELRKEIPSSVVVELSGGMRPDTIAAFADCGADVISMGSLTHSVTALDMSFLLEGAEKR